MPALKTKTNLPNPTKKDSSSATTSNKNKPYPGKAQLAKAKQASKNSKAKGVATNENAPPPSNPGRKADAAKLQLEVVIERSVKRTDQVMEEEDELSSAADDQDHVEDGSMPGGLPFRNSNGTTPSIQGHDQDRTDETEEAEFWKGDDQESISDVIDDLLKSNHGHKAALKADVEKGVPSKTRIMRQNQLGNVAGQNGALKLSKTEQKTIDTLDFGSRVHAQPPNATTSVAFPTIRSQPNLAKGDESDLTHSVILKVIEHALKKNIDWHTMAKELETEGLTKSGQSTKAKGKGKGKKVDPVDAEGEGAGQRKMRSKVDGNLLYDMFHYTILPALKDRKVLFGTDSDA